LFRAGFLTKDQRDAYAKTKLVSFIVSPVIAFFLMYLIGGIQLGILGIIMGVLCGYLLPQAGLDRKIRKRDDECMYYYLLSLSRFQ
jgi:hypothetical protein